MSVEWPLLRMEELVAGISAVFSSNDASGDDDAALRKARDDALRHLLAKYCNGKSDDWSRYAHFLPQHYTRNLIYHNEEFELMVLCWGNGHVSRIHNHDSSDCWLTVLDGSVDERNFEFVDPADAMDDAALADSAMLIAATPPPGVPGVLSSRRPCPKLREVSQATVSAGTTAFINDKMGLLHSIGHSSSGALARAGAVTLHLYAPPIRRATLYEREENRVVMRAPGFHSVDGQVLPPKPAGVALREERSRQKPPPALAAAAAKGPLSPAPAPAEGQTKASEEEA